MPSKLAFVETPEQLTYVPDDHRMISLSPMVEVALEEAGRPYARPEDYFDERTLEEEGVANFGRVERFCSILDRVLQQAMPLAKEHDVHPAMFNFLPLKVLYDAFFIRAFQVRRILEAAQPDRILCFNRAQPDLQQEWYSLHESLYVPILGAMAQHFHTELNKQTVPEKPAVRRDRAIPLSGRWKPALTRRLRSLLDLMAAAVSHGATGRVLCLDLGYNLPCIASELIRCGTPVWIWDGARRPARLGTPESLIGEMPLVSNFRRGELQMLSEQVLAEPELQDFWAWEGCSFWRAVYSRLARVVTVCLPEAVQHITWAERVLDRLNPGIVLASRLAFPRERAIAHAAQRRGVPVVVSHHGEIGTHHVPVFFYQDWNYASGGLCYGKGVTAYVRRYAKHKPALRATGAPMIAESRRKAPSRRAIRRYLGLDASRPVVLYVPTNMDGNDRYISYKIPSETTCFRIQKRIAWVLGKHPEYQTVIKYHHNSPYNPLAAWTSRKPWAHMKNIFHPPFSKLIHLADTVIIDAPSTALLEALQADSSIYIFNDWFRWEPGALTALEKVAVYLDDLDAFCGRLDGDLTTGLALQPRPQDDEFLRLFCRPEKGLPSARLAAQAIRRILETGVLDWRD